MSESKVIKEMDRILKGVRLTQDQLKDIKIIAKEFNAKIESDAQKELKYASEALSKLRKKEHDY